MGKSSSRFLSDHGRLVSVLAHLGRSLVCFFPPPFFFCSVSVSLSCEWMKWTGGLPSTRSHVPARTCQICLLLSHYVKAHKKIVTA